MENKFYSQVKQDKWVCEFFNYKKNGYFLDLGAYDGIELSNTYYLEKELNWSGICVEASKIIFEKLKLQRICICLNNAIYNKNIMVNFISSGMGGRISNNNYTESVQAVTIKDILKKNNSPKIIDYISLDIEGDEYEALLGFPFTDYEAILWTIEHNLYNGVIQRILKANIFNIMCKNGYEIFKENVGTSSLYPMEDWYVNKKYKK